MFSENGDSGMIDSNNNPLDSYLRYGEYFLWSGTGRSNLRCPLPFAILFLALALIWTVLALQERSIFSRRSNAVPFRQ